MQGSSQDVNVIDQAADGAFVGSAVLVSVIQEEFRKCKRVRKPTQKGQEYQILLLEEQQRKLSQNWIENQRRLMISYIQQRIK